MDLRERYKGIKYKPKRQVVKPSHRSRLSFDWPVSEDTSRAFNEGLDTVFECPLLFGRGFRAGIDRLEQKKRQLKKQPTSCSAHKSLPPCWAAKQLSDMTPRDWRIFQEDFNLLYKGCHAHAKRPMRSWEESGLNVSILKAVHKSGYRKPSPIQMAAIPISLAHVDVIGIAHTGSGKTASFVLPMLNHISALSSLDNEVEGPHALILAPTRELALQICKEVVKLSRYLKVKVVMVIGGHSIEKQGMELSSGCDVIIATPGRLLDCLEKKFVVLNQCYCVVVDEADRMVSMGFEEQVVRILNVLPLRIHDKANQGTISMFSATMSSAAERIARCYLKDPVIINVGSTGKTTELITQQVIMVRDSEKLQKLQALLDTHDQNKLILVFVNTRNVVHDLVQQLDWQGCRATSFHGGMLQEEREASLEAFRSKKINCLVATDVAGRGIDIHGITHVVNYEMPKTIEKYIHRIGRTGRAGNTGLATTFLSPLDAPVFYDLKEFLIQSNSLVPPELARHEASKAKPGSFGNCF